MATSAPTRPQTLTGWKKTTGVVAGVLFACVLGYGLGRGVTSLGSKTPEGLRVAPEALDFGEVWETPAFRWKVPIQNPDDREVQIERFLPSCACLGVEPASLVIPAKSTVEVTVVIDLSHPRADEVELPIRDVSVDVVPQIGGRSVRGLAWTVHGRAKATFNLTPSTVTFWDEVVRGQAFPTRRVAVRTQVPLDRLTPRFDPEAVSVKVVKGERAEEEFALEVTPSETLSLGTFTTEVMVEGMRKDGGPSHAKVLKIKGAVRDDIEASPSTVAFGVRELGEKAEETVVIRSHTGEAIEIERIEVSSSTLSVVPVSEMRLSGTALRVTQQFTEQGPQSAVAKVRIREKGQASRMVSIRVTYYGFGR
jgi:hypothetical protein